ncbi:MAG: carbohydrate kinase family protein [Pseudomonadales bacterium]|nr:carbohydrate kinase family protein [Pseudomonadales bacterium]
MYDVITIGSSLIDSFIKSKNFDFSNSENNVQICFSYGSKIDVEEYLLRTGGGGSNTAVGFSRMGYRTGIITEIGRDTFAKIILDDLKKEYVSTNLVISEKQEKTGGSIILVGKDGGRTVMVHRGASAMLDPEDIPKETISRADWIHLSSISGRLNTLKYIFSVLKLANKKISWNPGKKELTLINENKLIFSDIPCELLFVNYEEWKLVEKYHQEIFANVKQIIVTNGKKGGKVYVEGQINTEFISGEVESLDDTGAGDAFAVGYVTAYLKKKNIEECCQWGKRNAVSVIQQVGAKPGLLTIDQIKVHN